MIPTEKLERLLCILVLIFVLLFLLIAHTGCTAPCSLLPAHSSYDITLIHIPW